MKVELNLSKSEVIVMEAILRLLISVEKDTIIRDALLKLYNKNKLLTATPYMFRVNLSMAKVLCEKISQITELEIKGGDFTPSLNRIYGEFYKYKNLQE